MNHNPYAPPKAVVADPVIDPAPFSRPHEVTLAARLLWVALALGALSFMVDSVRAASGGSLPLAAVVISLLTLGLLGWLTHKIAHGRNWARIVFLIMFVVGVPIFFLQLPAMLERSVFATAISVAISILQIVALYLVFIGVGARWFRRRRGSDEAVA